MLNRFMMFDTLESHWMHYGYDSRSRARQAARKLNLAAGDPRRYRVVDQLRDVRPDAKPTRFTTPPWTGRRLA